MLLTLLDSPLNKAGKLQVYIHTEKNVLIEVNPSIRIPRTYKRFAGLMVQLLHKLKIRAVDGPDALLKVIKNPVEAHLPAGARRSDLIFFWFSANGFVAVCCPYCRADRIGTSRTGRLVKINEYVTTLPQDSSSVFVLGALAHGKVEVGYVDETISISGYPLSGSVACGKLMNAFESAWGVL
jgi:rRNA small subunit pseudouridine methyltransferase Nep1